jgi:hypothetical protein
MDVAATMVSLLRGHIEPAGLMYQKLAVLAADVEWHKLEARDWQVHLKRNKARPCPSRPPTYLRV